MSVYVSTWVWKYAAVTDSGEMLVLLALADFSDDAGVSFPSVAMLQKRCRMSERGLRYALRRLEALGLLEVEIGRGRGVRSTYRIMTESTVKGQPLPLLDPDKRGTAVPVIDGEETEKRGNLRQEKGQSTTGTIMFPRVNRHGPTNDSLPHGKERPAEPERLIPTERKARERDPVWDALWAAFVAIFGEPLGDTNRKRRAVAVASCKKAGVTPEQIALCHERWTVVMPEEATETPHGIMANLDVLLTGPQINGRGNGHVNGKVPAAALNGVYQQPQSVQRGPAPPVLREPTPEEHAASLAAAAVARAQIKSRLRGVSAP